MTGRRATHPAAAYAVALSLLPGVGPVGLLALLSVGDPMDVWSDVLAGRLGRPPVRRGQREAARMPWDVAARGTDVGREWQRTSDAGIGVTWIGCDDYPEALASDPERPAVLFWRGSIESLSQPCVALVGTRSATSQGRTLAWEMGRDLAAAGVCVVSGLALGIDGASHRGALSTGCRGATVGVAASGVDRAYPARHRDLWEEVVGLGAVVSETPPGRPAQTWRFPARNRIIAGLVRMVVVVESHTGGGSLITADAAIARGVEVRAVPGPVRSPASAGTNQLLFDGPGPVRDAGDILLALGTAVPATRPPSAQSRAQSGRRPPVTPSAVAPGPTGEEAVGGHLEMSGPAPLHEGDETVPDAGVLDVMGWEPRSLNWVAARTGGGLAEIAGTLDALARAGSIAEERGWWQRVR